MRVLAIGRHLIEIVHGKFEGDGQCGRHFWFMVAGELLSNTLNSFMSLSQGHRRYSILPALSLDGILTVDIIEGSFTTARFARFVDGLLDRMNPFPGPNSVIIMDNCRIHKSDVIIDMIHEWLVLQTLH